MLLRQILEIADYQLFLLSKCFLPYQGQIPPFEPISAFYLQTLLVWASQGFCLKVKIEKVQRREEKSSQKDKSHGDTGVR